ncbi:putative electron transport chain factor [Namao virus]|nr:putative electron transport chain factor [Namao virus]
MFKTIRKQIKSHPSLIPIIVVMATGASGAMFYILRLALRNPYITWDRKNNPEPWNNIKHNEQYKFFAVNMDYSKLDKNRPDF